MSRPRSGDDLGQVAGHRLTGLLGEGGQGAVYLGLSPSGGEVAIKVLNARMSEDPEGRRRFFRQVELARRVAPFCTARVLDTGMHGDRPYIVSEYVPGDSLDRVVRTQGPRTGGGLERLAVATATALAAIHRAGVVHRDFKPGNVILGPEGPVVIDFGISHALDHAVTQSGAFGTPGFMAPEQLDMGPIGPAADVFGWAATMVFAATGRRPFAGDSVAAVLRALLYDEPDVSGVPEPLRPLVAACLDKNPDRRLTADTLVRTLTSHPAASAPLAPAPTAHPEPTPHHREPAAAPEGAGHLEAGPTASGERPGPASGAAADGAVTRRVEPEARAWAERTGPGSETSSPGRRRVPRRALVAGGVAVVAAAAVVTAVWPRAAEPVRATGTSVTVASGAPATAAPAKGDLAAPLVGHTNDVRSAVVGTLDGVPVALTGSDDETARLWNLRTSRQIGAPLIGHTEWIRSVVLDQLDGAPIAVTAGDDDTARVWDLRTGRSRTLTGHTGDVKSVATGRIGGRHVAVTAAADGTARVWDLRTGEQVGEPLTGHDGAVWAVAAGQVGGTAIAVTTGDDGTVREWDLTTGEEIGRPMTGHRGWVRSVVLGNLDGVPVAITGGEDMTARVWDLRTRKELGPPLAGHTNGVWSVAVTNLGGVPVAVTGSEDATARVWDLRTRKELGAPYTGHTDAVWSVSTGLLDGRPIVISAGRDQSARVWAPTR